MNFDSYKRKWVEAFTSWKREPKEAPYSSDVVSETADLSTKEQNVYLHPPNQHLDIYTKRAALKVSTSVVCLKSYSGEKEIFQCSGTIIESVNTYSIILTTASLLRCSTIRNAIADNIRVIVHLFDGRSFDGQIESYDFHYNVAAIKILSDTPLPIASLAHLSDSITIDPSKLRVTEEKPFQLRPHSSSFNLIPGDSVIALSRFYTKPYDIMAAPGEFSIDRCDYDFFDCKELFMASCRIMRCGIGGPLINPYGEVIGICFQDLGRVAFLPINIASMWWEHYKEYRQSRRPWLGMEVTNLYAAGLEILERIISKFPDVLKGVIVEEVVPGSSAESAGIKHNDVIIQFGGKRIQSFLELFEIMWNNVGESVELTVIRASHDVPVHFSMVVEEATSDKLYSWPLWKAR
ncbi:putative protease Do-like 14 [Lycium ferocissimum]|uniref:putative protease Do-like 14 n=1 Tax=Lycium ferocissimum TaxID=112874 RepID=UPI00281501D8|nr:putative protease Do-like 14 [Lycium ferocissimum]XP_059286420.1 putative protease Do-like 14 [Lycium ferocissimum]XP_059286427.1 putative protease Do-like 14 [Lycium ferocissimum]